MLVIEAATDPDLTTGYYDRVNPSKPEIGDPCNLQITMMDGVPIQKVWSQEGCRCI